MRSIFFLLVVNFVFTCNLNAQDIILISNPSLEAKEGHASSLPRGWNELELNDFSPGKINWKGDDKSPSHGHSYMSLSNTDSLQQSIHYKLNRTPILAFRSYKIELDVSIMKEVSSDTRIQVIGYGQNLYDSETLATSWPIDHLEWKKVILKLHSTKQINSFSISMLSDDKTASVAIDNLSNLERIKGNYYCENLVKNGYKRVTIDPIITKSNGQNFKIFESRYHCVYSSFYTQKILFDNFGIWDDIIFYEGHENERLVWSNIAILPDHDETFTIAASGIEDKFDLYASVIVIDSKGNDVFHPSHPLSKKIQNQIGLWIQENNESDKDFYEIYEEEMGN